MSQMRVLHTIAVLAVLNLGFGVAAGCNCGEPAEPSGVEQGASPVPNHLAEREHFGIRISAPRGWTDASQQHIDQLVGSVTGRDPSAKVKVLALTDGVSTVPLLTLYTIEHGGPTEFEMSVSGLLDALEAEADGMATLRKSKLASARDCNETRCDQSIAITSDTFEQSIKDRVWRQDGRIHETICACVSAGCDYFESCSLPAVPAGATPLSVGNRQ